MTDYLFESILVYLYVFYFDYPVASIPQAYYVTATCPGYRRGCVQRDFIWLSMFVVVIQ